MCWNKVIINYIMFELGLFTLSGASSVYYNLHRLSRLVKDQVSYPLLSFMRAGKEYNLHNKLVKVNSVDSLKIFHFHKLFVPFFAALGLPQLCGLMALPAEVKVL